MAAYFPDTFTCFLGNVALLVNLLGLVAGTKITVYAATVALGEVGRAPMPNVRIKNKHRTRRRNDANFVGMFVVGVGHGFVGQGAALVGFGNDAGGAVLFRKIVQQPNAVAHLKRAVGDGIAPIDVEFLVTFPRLGGPIIER